ncbi:MAG: PolC-type DNA polymerase III [Lachnospiraceae bacterium]|nr:PolC-type DNA polymerase III [Lachnospiraceae bacterium]
MEDKKKSFFDVFKSLKLSDRLTEIFADTIIEHVIKNKTKNVLKIILSSDHLIGRNDIRKVESEIKRQLFKNDSLSVVINEHFLLPDDYGVEEIMQEYKASLYEDIRNYDALLHYVLSKGRIDYPAGDVIRLTLDVSSLEKYFEEEIEEIFDRVFYERFNRNITVICEYENLGEKGSYLTAEDRLKGALREADPDAVPDDDDEYIDVTGEFTGDEGGDTEDWAFEEKDDDEGSKTGLRKSASGSGEKADSGSKKERSGYNKYRNDRQFGAGRKGRFRGSVSDNPDVIYGREFDEDPVSIEDLDDVIGDFAIKGKVIRYEQKETRKGHLLVLMDITDYTDTISAKIFPREEQLERLNEFAGEGSTILLYGTTTFDKFTQEYSFGNVRGIMKTDELNEGTKRSDDAHEKRVELHCHTKMSDMDGVSDVSDIIKRAVKWGHKALAITDHGVVQAFTEAFHTMQGLYKKNPDLDFKLIYGMEGYLVNDLILTCTDPGDHTIMDASVVFDIETTGLSPEKDAIIEIGAVKLINGEISERFSEFVNPLRHIPGRITGLTGITDEMVAEADTITEVLPRFLDFCADAVLVAHNAEFDLSFIKENAARLGIDYKPAYIDTMKLAMVLLPELHRFRLNNVAKALKVPFEEDKHHRAVYDAEGTAEIHLRFIKKLAAANISSLTEINRLAGESDDLIKKSRDYHVIILAKNEIGRINLYRLVSESHIKYFNRNQRIPKSLIEKYREGLIIGSACEQGELFRALVDGKSEGAIKKIVDFYDYLEIQPLGNNSFMIDDEKHEDIHSYNDLMYLNRRIVELGEKYEKPVVATCDVHFLDPEDEIYRRIIMAGKGFKDADNQAPLYFRTTEEMMSEFEYLGYEKAYEVVIKNTNLIADMIDRIEPVRPDKCPPVIENSDQILRDICHRKAHELYGEDLPEEVSSRLEKELDSIISNGFAVMYIIAQKLVWKSVEDGYLVGSRGSVGSSLVATMAGITEVNPLPPHYLCPECHYVDFKSDEVRAYAGRAGCDMPDKKCPVCGTDLHKEGFDIPFETFLGFNGDKEPDIDLNFSGEYQSKAHKYTEVIFGDGQTFRAGTIGTLADKTAYGYVKKYYEERGVEKRHCEINRITQGCTGIHRTTGQHPGGIIVLPLGEEIYSFTPVQHPANDNETDIITTHFDYHSIDHNLLKLDILGHDDPTMIRMLQDLTGTDPTTVPLDDQKVMSLFRNTEALGIDPEDIDGCRLGALGIPEFGTDFAMGMLIDTKPSAFSDLVRIAGLSHGTDVWRGNAETLIKDGQATIATAICTRDDIMVYLINMGLEDSMAFDIMEAVRKGKVAKGQAGKWEEWKQEMTDHGVPEWYIWSCEKIQYMFPKAHAAAYVMMAWRIAYYKINYPLEYYAAYFSIRADAFNYEKMCMGKDRLLSYLEEYRKRPKESLLKKEQDEIKDMRLVQEMYARGFEFTPIDLFRAKAHKCQIVDGKIMPSFDSIEGLGDKAADAVVEACKDGPFLSKDDFRERTKVSTTVMETLEKLDLLKGLPKSNQLSLFDNLMSE